MKVQANINNYAGTIKKNNMKSLSPDLFLDEEKKKRGKAKFEIRNENGYIRHYIIKANGEKILVKEVKQQQELSCETGRGEFSESLDKKLIEQLTSKLPPNQRNKEIDEKIIGQRETRINKYKAGI